MGRCVWYWGLHVMCKTQGPKTHARGATLYGERVKGVEKNFKGKRNLRFWVGFDGGVRLFIVIVSS